MIFVIFFSVAKAHSDTERGEDRVVEYLDVLITVVISASSREARNHQHIIFDQIIFKREVGERH